MDGFSVDNVEKLDQKWKYLWQLIYSFSLINQ